MSIETSDGRTVFEGTYSRMSSSVKKEISRFEDRDLAKKAEIEETRKKFSVRPDWEIRQYASLCDRALVIQCDDVIEVVKQPSDVVISEEKTHINRVVSALRNAQREMGQTCCGRRVKNPKKGLSSCRVPVRFSFYQDLRGTERQLRLKLRINSAYQPQPGGLNGGALGYSYFSQRYLRSRVLGFSYSINFVNENAAPVEVRILGSLDPDLDTFSDIDEGVDHKRICKGGETMELCSELAMSDITGDTDCYVSDDWTALRNANPNKDVWLYLIADPTETFLSNTVFVRVDLDMDVLWTGRIQSKGWQSPDEEMVPFLPPPRSHDRFNLMVMGDVALNPPLSIEDPLLRLARTNLTMDQIRILCEDCSRALHYTRIKKLILQENCRHVSVFEKHERVFQSKLELLRLRLETSGLIRWDAVGIRNMAMSCYDFADSDMKSFDSAVLFGSILDLPHKDISIRKIAPYYKCEISALKDKHLNILPVLGCFDAVDGRYITYKCLTCGKVNSWLDISGTPQCWHCRNESICPSSWEVGSECISTLESEEQGSSGSGETFRVLAHTEDDLMSFLKKLAPSDVHSIVVVPDRPECSEEDDRIMERLVKVFELHTIMPVVMESLFEELNLDPASVLLILQSLEEEFSIKFSDMEKRLIHGVSDLVKSVTYHTNFD